MKDMGQISGGQRLRAQWSIYGIQNTTLRRIAVVVGVPLTVVYILVAVPLVTAKALVEELPGAVRACWRKR